VPVDGRNVRLGSRLYAETGRSDRAGDVVDP